MPDSSAGTKELYSAWIAVDWRVIGPSFHSEFVPRETIKTKHWDKRIEWRRNCSMWNISAEASDFLA
jgi:hypothetical protein